MGEGGPQAILNLRKVCSFTKEWIDTLDTHTREKIFFRIPISFTINPKNIQKFNKNPPPPGATSIIIRDNGETRSNTRDLKQSFPTFFTFWEQKMTALVTDYSIVPFQKFGLGEDVIPQKLKYFQSNCDFVYDKKLMNWEHIEVAIFNRFEKEPDLSFFSTLASIQTFKRLEITSECMFREQESINGFQLLMETKKHEKDFSLIVHLDAYMPNHTWNSVLGSLLSSSYQIQLSMSLMKVSATMQDLKLNKSMQTKFLQAIYQLKIHDDSYETVHHRLNNLNLHLFPNLKAFKWKDYVVRGTPEDTLFNNLCSNIASSLPKSLQYLQISRMPFITLSLPESLTYIHLSMEDYLLSPSDCRDSLYLISEHCSLLNKLKVITCINGLSEWKIDHPKSYSFCSMNVIIYYILLYIIIHKSKVYNRFL